jgi:hypothetical protein
MILTVPSVGTKGMTYAASPIEHLTCGRMWLGLEPCAPIAEGLDRNPVSLAILTLIELALKPCLMVRPPKSLTVTFAN